MLFNSIPYLLFLPGVTIVLFLIPKRIQWFWLLLCSTFFYYTLLPVYLIVFISLIPLNYYFGIRIENAGIRKRKTFIWALILNLLVLVFFKYFGVLDSIINSITSIKNPDTFWRIILPIGLSYFIFTLLSYLIEIKRGTITAERHIGILASSLMFFPKLLQGPIERPGQIIPQFREEKSFDYNRTVEGLKLMLWGYFKKLVVADRLAIYVNAVYGNTERHNGTSFAVATFFYAFQIYADFSGYTDIALGSAKIMGFNLTNNFKRPYFATSIKDFWSRWHISFSTWLRDYIFLPLAYFFSRKMKEEKYLGIVTEKWIFLFSSLITFAICGIWHGEGANFLVWGLLFGVYLSYSNWTSGVNKNIRKKLKISRHSIFFTTYNIIITFILVLFAFVFFRSDSLKDSFSIIHKFFNINGNLFIGEEGSFSYSFIAILILILAEIKFEYFPGKFKMLHNKSIIIRFSFYILLITYIGLFGVFDSGQFIYFQF